MAFFPGPCVFRALVGAWAIGNHIMLPSAISMVKKDSTCPHCRRVVPLHFILNDFVYFPEQSVTVTPRCSTRVG